MSSPSGGPDSHVCHPGSLITHLRGPGVLVSPDTNPSPVSLNSPEPSRKRSTGCVSILRPRDSTPLGSLLLPAPRPPYLWASPSAPLGVLRPVWILGCCSQVSCHVLFGLSTGKGDRVGRMKPLRTVRFLCTNKCCKVIECRSVPYDFSHFYKIILTITTPPFGVIL